MFLTTSSPATIATQKEEPVKEVSPGVYNATQLPQKIYGQEMILGVQPTDWLHLAGTLGYMDGQEDLDNDGDFEGEVLRGK